MNNIGAIVTRHLATRLPNGDLLMTMVQMQRKSILRFAGVAAAFVLLAAACSSNGSVATPNEPVDSESTVAPVSSTSSTSSPEQTDSGQADGEEVASAELVDKACAEGTVVYYTTQSTDDEQRIVEPFKAAYPCLDVQIVSVTSTQQYQRLVAEHGAGKVQADVGLMTEPSLLDELAQSDVINKWTPPSSDMYASAPYPGGPYWYPAGGSVTNIIYNKELVAPEDVPDSWEDLEQARWKGLIGVLKANSGAGGFGQWFLFQKFADWAALKEQDVKAFDTVSPIIQGVSRGEFEIGVTCDVCSNSAVHADDSVLSVVYPAEGVFYAPYGMYITANSPHPAAGELFGNWYLSREGQSSLVAVRGGYSNRADVAAPEGKPELSSLKVYSMIGIDEDSVESSRAAVAAELGY